MGHTTQTGIPITECGDCGKTHPVTRRHCSGCGTATVFLADDQVCIRCRDFPAAR
jgi:uncharacterized OB-fold protein